MVERKLKDIVIHEFGLIYPNMESLLDLNIPIIEDLAMSLFSQMIQVE
jgi:hypothetical protein